MSRVTQPWVEPRPERTPAFTQHGKNVALVVLLIAEIAIAWYLLTWSGTL